MSKVRVAIIVGGPSSERNVSVVAGKNVFNNLDKDRFDPTLIEIDPEFNLIFPGSETENKDLTIFNLGYFRDNFDLIFTLSHGSFGEDGHLQAILDLIGLPYTHSGIIASSLSMDKHRVNKILSLLDKQNISFQIPPCILVYNYSTQEDQIRKFVEEQGMPLILKPNAGGSSLSTFKIKTYEQLVETLESNSSVEFLIQKFIEGREYTCPVFKNSRSQPKLNLIAGEFIIEREIADYEVKYSDDNFNQEIFPPRNTPKAIIENIEKDSLFIHDILGCDGLTRSDFRVDNEGNIFFLEINTCPGLTSASLCQKSAAALGYNYTQLLTMICELGLEAR